MNYPQDMDAETYWTNIACCRSLLEMFGGEIDWISEGICDGARKWLRENCCEPDL